MGIKSKMDGSWLFFSSLIAALVGSHHLMFLMQLQGVEIGCFKQSPRFSCRSAGDLRVFGGRCQGTGRQSPVLVPRRHAARGSLRRAVLRHADRGGYPPSSCSALQRPSLLQHRKVFPGHRAAWGHAGKGIACDRAEDSACCWERVGQMGGGGGCCAGRGPAFGGKAPPRPLQGSCRAVRGSWEEASGYMW